MRVAQARCMSTRARPRAPTKLSPPHRIDLDARAVVQATWSLLTTDEVRARASAERVFVDDAVAFLSIRSGLCALLQAQQHWPAGSEILVSAITIDDIIKVIEAHGFVAVAVDVDVATLAPDPSALAAVITPRTRAVLVAHLFGARVDLEPVHDLAAHHGLLVLEDCAQAFVGRDFVGHPRSDVVMFSFGTIKTNTALGGALFTVRDAVVRARLRAVQAQWPQQSTTTFACKVAKAVAFIGLQHPRAYAALAHIADTCGTSIGDVGRKATRGFHASSTPHLLCLLRQRPCPALLAFLAWRLRHFDVGRTAQRARAGEQVRAALVKVGCADAMPGHASNARTHWLLPLSTTKATQLREQLWAMGIDASSASNMTAVGGARATRLVDQLIFVPVYPELRDGIDVVARVVCNAIREERAC